MPDMLGYSENLTIVSSLKIENDWKNERLFDWSVWRHAQEAVERGQRLAAPPRRDAGALVWVGDVDVARRPQPQQQQQRTHGAVETRRRTSPDLQRSRTSVSDRRRCRDILLTTRVWGAGIGAARRRAVPAESQTEHRTEREMAYFDCAVVKLFKGTASWEIIFESIIILPRNFKKCIFMPYPWVDTCILSHTQQREYVAISTVPGNRQIYLSTSLHCDSKTMRYWTIWLCL